MTSVVELSRPLDRSADGSAYGAMRGPWILAGGSRTRRRAFCNHVEVLDDPEEPVLPTSDEWTAHAVNADWWHAAIGWVVTDAASLEAAIGTLLYALRTGGSDHLYAHLVGRLLKDCRTELPGLARRDESLGAHIRETLDEVDPLLERRNDVVHGWWRFGIDGVSAIRGRARNKAPELIVSQVSRTEIAQLRDQLEDARRAVLKHATAVAALASNG